MSSAINPSSFWIVSGSFSLTARSIDPRNSLTSATLSLPIRIPLDSRSAALVLRFPPFLEGGNGFGQVLGGHRCSLQGERQVQHLARPGLEHLVEGPLRALHRQRGKGRQTAGQGPGSGQDFVGPV